MTNKTTADSAKEIRNLLIRWAVVLGLLGVFALWATWRMAGAASRLSTADASAVSTSVPLAPQIEYWTCTMHPEIRQENPGDCPVCGMELVAKYAGSSRIGEKPAVAKVAPAGHAAHVPAAKAWYRCTMPECGDQGSADPNSRCPVCGMKRERVDAGGQETGDFDIALGPRARQLAQVETAPASKRMLFKRIRTVGRVVYDETRYKMVSAWIDGRIDRLFADFTGMNVSEGDHLVEIYSPDLISAQEEYLQAVRSVAVNGDTPAAAGRRSREQVRGAARRKLELLGVTDAQIAALEGSDQPQTRFVIHAPIGGTILAKTAMEGKYVKTGDTLYTIADLTHLWLLVDLYEADLPWVKPFQEVRVTTRSLPGEVFGGRIVFVDPKVNPLTRTVPVRVHVENPDLRLKPEMWVTAEIDAGLSRSAGGVVPAPDGAWACPMHPWETAHDAGVCPVCEMNLVAVEELPQYAPPTESAAILAVPRSAVMQTGQRAIVYVESVPGTYRGVEVSVGPLARDAAGDEFYPILGGLDDGAAVVTRGNFAIDSQMQLAGKRSLFAARGLENTQPDEGAGDAAMQTRCPVMGGAIDPEVFITYRGAKVYFCCWGCDDKFLAEPEKYIPKLPTAVQAQIRAASPQKPGTAGPTTQITCPVMGNPIDREIHTDFRGVRIYFCCPPCIEDFQSDPNKYIPKLPLDLQAKLQRAATEEASHD